MPSFLAGAFAVAGVAAAAGPLIIHLLNRRRFRVVQWAAMDFLREALQRNRRILHLRDWLLLALRTLCVLLFGLAMARPFFASTDGKIDPDQPVHAVLLVDNSLSMGYQRLGGTLLDDARSRAREFIERLPEGSRIHVLPVCGSAGEFALDPFRTPQDALEALETIQLVDRQASLAQALDLAKQACQQAPDFPAKRVVLLGDQQAVNWPATGLETLFAGLPELQIVDVSADAPSNAWVADFRVQDGLADVESDAVFLVTLRYEGRDPRPGVDVTLTVDGEEIASRVVDLEPGQTRELSFLYRFDVEAEPNRPTLVPAQVTLSADDLPLDDQRTLVVPVVAALPVVFVDQLGEDENPGQNRYGETFRLRRLLSPVTSRNQTQRQLVQIVHRKIEELDRAALENARLCVIAGVAQPGASVTLLREFVEQGGQLVICAGSEFDPAAWQAQAWLDGAGVLPLPLAEEAVGSLPEDATGELNPLQLDFNSLVHDYFIIDQAPRDELVDLYRGSLFFRWAVPSDAADALAALRAADASRLTEQRGLLAAVEERRRAWSEQEQAGLLSAEEQAELEADEARLAELDPRWLLWRQPAAGVAGVDPDQLAQQMQPRVLARLTDGTPLFVERRLGAGNVLFFASGVYSNWSTLTTTNAVLCFDRIFRSMLERTLPRRNLDAVEQLELPIDPAEHLFRFVLSRPVFVSVQEQAASLEDDAESAGESADETGAAAGDAAPGVEDVSTGPSGLLETSTTVIDEPLSVEALGGDHYGLSIRNVAVRGLYRVTAYRDEDGGALLDEKLWELPLAVNGAEQESALAGVAPQTLLDRPGMDSVRWIGRGDAIRLDGAQVRGQDLWKWLMGLVLAGLLIEWLVLAWPRWAGERAA